MDADTHPGLKPFAGKPTCHGFDVANQPPVGDRLITRQYRHTVWLVLVKFVEDWQFVARFAMDLIGRRGSLGDSM